MGSFAAHAPMQAAAAMPAHIAIIMDGNGRWAKEHGVTRAKGHTEGAEALRRLIDSCKDRPFIRQLTLYAFSTENWNRSPEEVSDLMNLLRHYVKREAPTLHKNGIRLRFIGQRESLAHDIQRDLAEVEALTAANTRLTVTLALSYGARQELADAMRAMASALAAGTLKQADITPERISQHLYTADMPDPDLMIRTGGEQRLSNFLLWQSAYAEFYFCDTLWPDFSSEQLDAAIACYSQRERRFGKRNEA